MRVSPRARRAMRKRNAINAAAKARAVVADMRSGIPEHMVRLHVKALGASEPVGTPRMGGNSLHDGQFKRLVQRMNGGLSKDVRETITPADPLASAVPSYVPPGDPEHIRVKRVKPRPVVEELQVHERFTKGENAGRPRVYIVKPR